jgi:ribulose-5-phosphate 4-epimerase/fuculose-1-phosphate aldolase
MTNSEAAGIRERISADEWSARVELAALYRLVDYFRWSDSIYTHISLRVPGEDSFLINPYGYLYEEVNASSLVKVDIRGNVLDDPVGIGINRAGFIIHSAIHTSRADVRCVLHTHTRAGAAVAAHADGLLPISQYSAIFIGRVAYHEFEGIAIRPDEQARLAADLGDKFVMILRNHGLLITGRSAAETFCLTSYLERACEIQIAATGGGSCVRRITDESVMETQSAFDAAGGGYERDWAAMLRLIRRIAPDYRS